MLMELPDDVKDTIAQMLGTTAIPADTAELYWSVKKMLDKASGGSVVGLQTLAVIVMLAARWEQKKQAVRGSAVSPKGE